MDRSRKSRYQVVFWVQWAFLTLFITHDGYAIDLTDEEQAFFRTKDTLVFVSQTRYPPFEFMSQDRQSEGMMIDVVHWMAVEIGFRPVFMNMSFKEAQEAVLSGKADVLTSLFLSDNRKERFDFTSTLFDVPASIFVRAERTDIHGLADLEGKTIAIQRGDYAKEFLETRKIIVNILDTLNFAEATDAVIAGQADAVIGDEQIVLHHIYRNRLTDRIKKVGEPLYIGKNCMAAQKGNDPLIGAFNKAIDKARRSGVLDNISRKWLGTYYHPSITLFSHYLWPITFLAGGVFLLFISVWVWNYRLRTMVQKKTAEILLRERNLRDSEERFHSIFDNSLDGILFTAPDGTIFSANPAACQLLGRSERELREGGRDLVMDATDPRLPEALEERARTGRFRGELNFRHKGGAVFPVEITSTVFSLNNGELRTCIIMRDIRGRKLTEDALRQSEKKYRRLFENLIDVYYRVDSEGKILMVSPSITRASGYSPEEVLGTNVKDYYAYPEKREEIIERLKKDGYADDCEVQLKVKNGSIRWVFFNARVDTDQDGNVIGIEGIGRDITENRRSRDALRRAYDFRNLIIDHVAEGLCVCNPIAEPPYIRFSVWNDRMTEITGYTMEEINRLGWYQTVYPNPDLRTRAKERMDEMRNGNDLRSEEWEIVRVDGEKRILGISTSIVPSDDGIVHVLALMKDITERKLAEQALLESETKFRSYADQALAGIYLIQDGVFKYVNPKFAEMFEYTTEECLSNLPFEKLVHMDDWTLVTEQVNARISGKIDFVHYTFRGVKKNGEIFYVEIYGSASVHKGRPAAAGTILDITESRRFQEALKESEAILRAALHEKEVLLREIHHRVKNNIQVIISLLSLQADGVEDERTRQMLMDSQQRISAMSMVHETLYSNDTLSTISLSSYFSNLVSHLKSIYSQRSNVAIQMDIDPVELGLDQAIPCGLILTELVTNALKYAFGPDRDGKLWISAIRKPDQMLEMTVEDNGVGVPETLDFESGKTLGTRLVIGLVEDQLEGTWNLNRDCGTRWVIRWPVSG
jgi:PAS domain S-box-containing protein